MGFGHNVALTKGTARAIFKSIGKHNGIYMICIADVKLKRNRV